MSDEEIGALDAQFLEAVEAHKTHPPRLGGGPDGIYHCAACNPEGWWERPVGWLLRTRCGWAVAMTWAERRRWRKEQRRAHR